MFTAHQTIAALRFVVAMAGEDFVYSQHYGSGNADCFYGSDSSIENAVAAAPPSGQPACIVSRAIHLLAPEYFDSLVEGKTFVGQHSSVTNLFEPKARLVLEWAQQEQDNDRPWGRAVEVAVNRHEAGYTE